MNQIDQIDKSLLLANELSLRANEASSNKFIIKMGSEDCPRFNCAYHKLNLAIQYF